jgi:hypothetical protein
MFRSPLKINVLAVLTAALACAATIDSTYVGPSGQPSDLQKNYTVPENWAPVGVPNNSSSNTYNVTIPDKAVFVDIHVTINRLVLGGGSGDAALLVSETDTSEGSFTVQGDFTNDGLLLLSNANFTVNGNLKNFDAGTRTLTGGSYDISGSDIFPDGITPVPRSAILQFPGADIVHNASAIALRGEKADITDENGLNGLRNFADNTASGSFFVGADYVFFSPGDFSNAGEVFIEEFLLGTTTGFDAGFFAIPAGHKYIQTGGKTTNDGFFDGDVEIKGGTFLHSFSVQGNLTIENATLRPTSSYYGFVRENLTLGPGSMLQILIPGGTYQGHYDQLQVDGVVTLSGSTLAVDFTEMDAVLKNASFKIVDGKLPVVGSFGNVASGERLTTLNGKGSFVVDYDGEDVLLTRFRTIPPPAQFANISARGQVFTGDQVLIAGFIITGNGPKKIVVRGIGPSLGGADVASPLLDPVLELHDAKGALITTNNDWKDTQQTEIENTGIPPNDARESAIVATLKPGAYTIVLHGNNDLTGTALVEAYDLATDADSKLANISARGFVSPNNPVIAGFIVGGNGTGPSQVVARALTFSFLWWPIVGVGDPRIEIRDRNGVLIGRNDDYIGNDEVIEARGLAPDAGPFNAGESALRISLPPGQYTALLFGKGSGGLGLLELYDLYL